MLNELKKSKEERKITPFKVKNEVIQEALTYLKDNQAHLSPEYISAFHTDNDRALWTPSFVLPLPIESLEMKSVEGCCSLEGCNKPGWAVSTIVCIVGVLFVLLCVLLYLLMMQPFTSWYALLSIHVTQL